MGIGRFSPLFGVRFYQSCLIGRTGSDRAIGRIWPYMLSLVAALVAAAGGRGISTGFQH